MFNSQKENKKNPSTSSVLSDEQEKKLSFNEKITRAIMNAIINVEATSRDEEFQKLEYLMNYQKITSSYEDLRPLLYEFFNSRK